MYDSASRRGFLAGFGVAAAGAMTSPLAAAAQSRGTPSVAAKHADLAAEIDAMPMIDVHSHPYPALAPITEEIFLETLALSAWMLDLYFPAAPGETKTLYAQWRAADPAQREQLDRKYGIKRRFDEVVKHMRSTLLVENLIKEMAAFLRCKPTLADVIAARNEYTRGGFWRYVNDLYASMKLEGAMVQSGLGTLSAWNEPEPAFNAFKSELDAKVWEVVTASPSEYMNPQLSFADFVTAYRNGMRQRARRTGVVAFKSGIVKVSGADVQPTTDAQAEQAWEQFRKLTPDERARIQNRTWRPAFAKTIQDHVLWQACDIAYELEVPLHIHSGNGEGMDKISTHYPYLLENVARYPVELPQKPVQIVLLHAGYPHHMEAAYMSHIFPNVWFDMSIMTPFSNRGLPQRLLETFEVAPLSKVMYGSDVYHAPELAFLGAKWAKRGLSIAFSTLVTEGVLTRDDAARYARMILAENTRGLHKLDAARTS